MGRDHAAQRGMADRVEQGRRIVVGQMAQGACNSFAQEGWVAGAAEHVRVMVGFQQQCVAASQGLDHVGAGMAQVGQNAQAAVTVAATQLQGLACIVRHREGEKLKRAQGNRHAVACNPELIRRKLPFVSLTSQARAFTHPKGQACFLREAASMADMVAVFVGHEQALQVSQLKVDGFQSPPKFWNRSRPGKSR